MFLSLIGIHRLSLSINSSRRAAATAYDNDILFTFKGLLNEQAGANIRNEVAHGLLEESDAGSGMCLFFDAAVIKLLLLTALEAYSIYKSSERLKTVEKMELLELSEDINPDHAEGHFS